MGGHFAPELGGHFELNQVLSLNWNLAVSIIKITRITSKMNLGRFNTFSLFKKNKALSKIGNRKKENQQLENI